MKLDKAAWEAHEDWSGVDTRHDLPSDRDIMDHVVATLPYAEDHLREKLEVSLKGTRQLARLLGVSMSPATPVSLATPYGIEVEVSTQAPLSRGVETHIPELAVAEGIRAPGVAHALVIYLVDDVDPLVVGWVWHHVLYAQGRHHLNSGFGPDRQREARFLTLPPSRLRPIGELVVANPWQPAQVQRSLF